jgi:hypothetical protein
MRVTPAGKRQQSGCNQTVKASHGNSSSKFFLVAEGRLEAA